MKFSKLVAAGLIGLLLLCAATISSAQEGVLTSEEEEKAQANAETYKFQAEVNRMMKLIINSLYKNKEIFLRELISNASDALDKIRFLSLTDKSALGDTTDLRVQIQADRENNVLHITDTGIGMTKDDLIKNLGTIAKSGTAEFMEALDKSSDMGLIGQFGVGFYSVFLVADTVVVTTKNNNDKQYIWKSTAESDFTITEDPRGNTLGRGTRISLHMKPDAVSFLEESTLKELITKYSEFINYPIYLWTEKEETIEEPVTEEEEEPATESTDEEVTTEDATDEEEEEESNTKTTTRKYHEFEQINKNRPLWTRPPSEITEEEYNKFYEAFTNDKTPPLAHTHFSAEGEVEFKSLLFIPKVAPSNFYQQEEFTNGIKLFVRRVFITDELNDFIPRYLRFIKGLVDADDLPLNVSRETLQQSKLLKLIKKKVIRKTLDLIKELSEDETKYKDFLKEYGLALKLGVIEDSSNRKRLSQLLRFRSSKSGEDLISLDQYKDRLKKNQKQIFFLAGATIEELKTSPFLERLTARGYEVLLMTDAADEYVVQSLNEYEGLRFQNIAKDNLKIDEEDDEAKSAEAALEAQFTPLADWLKDAFASRVEKVRVSNRLTTSPCALVASQFGLSGNMERIVRSQAHAQNDPLNSFYFSQKKIFEINPKHPIIQEMLRRVEAGATDDLAEVANILYDTAVLRSGYALENTVDFASRIENVVRTNLNVDLNAKVEVDETEAEDAEPATEEGEEGEEHDHHDHDHEEL